MRLPHWLSRTPDIVVAGDKVIVHRAPKGIVLNMAAGDAKDTAAVRDAIGEQVATFAVAATVQDILCEEAVRPQPFTAVQEQRLRAIIRQEMAAHSLATSSFYREYPDAALDAERRDRTAICAAIDEVLPKLRPLTVAPTPAATARKYAEASAARARAAAAPSSCGSHPEDRRASGGSVA